MVRFWPYLVKGDPVKGDAAHLYEDLYAYASSDVSVVNNNSLWNCELMIGATSILCQLLLVNCWLYGEWALILFVRKLAGVVCQG